jgi:hypothetical protein
MEYLIKTYTNEGETVLDNCMGSGTTGVACKNLGRNFIGIELDKTYFDLATKTVMRTSDPEGSRSEAGWGSLQKTNLSVIPEGNYDVGDPTNGYVYTRGADYVLGFDYAVRQRGQLIGYALVNNDQDFVAKTEGYGTVLTTKGYPEKVEWAKVNL